MERQRLDAHYGRSVNLDLCHGCGLIWFDGTESLALTPGAVLRLFRSLHAHRDDRHPLAQEAMSCPRCRRRLVATTDRARATTFAARLVTDRAEIERTLRATPAARTSGLFGVVEGDISALVRLFTES